jgi:hypothetical protein
MHEHVFVLSEEIRRNYPDGWDEEHRIAHAACPGGSPTPAACSEWTGAAIFRSRVIHQPPPRDHRR